jgi:hypothetical protein
VSIILRSVVFAPAAPALERIKQGPAASFIPWDINKFTTISNFISGRLVHGQ